MGWEERREWVTTDDTPFIRYLYGLARDERDDSDAAKASKARAALAALRRGRGKEPGTVTEMYPLIIPRLRLAEAWEEQAWVDTTYFLIAALFAGHRWSREHPIENPPRNLGASFYAFTQMAKRDGRPVRESTEKRFAALLECDRSELPNHLRYAVNLLDDTPIDWTALLVDIGRWDAGRRTQLQWAKAFWPPIVATPADDEPNDEQSDDDDDDALRALVEEGE
jgi:CRISPR system Cascade subunit CasB